MDVTTKLKTILDEVGWINKNTDFIVRINYDVFDREELEIMVYEKYKGRKLPIVKMVSNDVTTLLYPMFADGVFDVSFPKVYNVLGEMSKKRNPRTYIERYYLGRV